MRNLLALVAALLLSAAASPALAETALLEAVPNQS